MIPSGVVVVTDRRQAPVPLPQTVAAAVAGGCRWVLLREKDLPRPERAALAERLRDILARPAPPRPGAGLTTPLRPAPIDGALHLWEQVSKETVGAPPRGALIVAGPDPLGGDAVHLAAGDATVRAPLVGRSCHDEVEVDRLTTEDYATVSPVFASASKPGYGPALGRGGLARLCRRAGRPVLALGGIETPEQAAACVDAGAAGVAVMGAVMRAADPAAVVAGMCEAVAGAEVRA